jgi:hypothetical protein
MFNKSNFKEWFDRYKYSELAATTSVVIASQFSSIFSALMTAYLITFFEYFAFYSVMIYRNYKTKFTKNREQNLSVSFREIAILIRDLFLEFGCPAVLDFFFIRPFCMYWMPILSGNYFVGIILGKIAADCFFYFFSIINYELMKKKP